MSECNYVVSTLSLSERSVALLHLQSFMSCLSFWPAYEASPLARSSICAGTESNEVPSLQPAIWPLTKVTKLRYTVSQCHLRLQQVQGAALTAAFCFEPPFSKAFREFVACLFSPDLSLPCNSSTILSNQARPKPNPVSVAQLMTAVSELELDRKWTGALQEGHTACRSTSRCQVQIGCSARSSAV